MSGAPEPDHVRQLREAVRLSPENVPLRQSLAATGLAAVVLISFVHPPKNSPMGGLAMGAFGFFLLGSFVSQWVASWLMTRRPTR